MSDYLQHGKFKYIDKWKSKAGKWVYKYADSANDKLKSLNDKYGPKVSLTTVSGGRALKYPQGGYDQKATTTTKNLIGGRTVSKQSVYQKSGRPSSPQLTTSKRDPKKSVWEKTKTGTKEGKVRAAAGFDQQRLSLYKKDKPDKRGYNYGIRTEYRDSKYDAERNRRYSRENAESRGSKFMKTLGSLNDKYGPKFIEETTVATSTGRVFVDSYVRNVIGGKKVRVESYSYDTD